MITTRLEFVEREYKHDLVLYLDALTEKLSHLIDKNDNSLDPKDEHYIQEGEDICSKALSIIEQMKKRSSLKRDETHLIAAANFVVGEFFGKFSSNEYLEKAKIHYERAKEDYEELGEGSKMEVTIMESMIREVVAKLSGTEAELDTAEDLVHWRERYNVDIELVGENHPVALNCGILLFRALHREGNQIEAERLLSKLVDTSRRIHGVEHNVTKEYSALLQKTKGRLVDLITAQGEVLCYLALRYENDGENIVVVGPLPTCPDDERKLDEEKTMTINSKDATPQIGTPVTCHGLRPNSMTHLNGKIGEIRDYSEDYRICFIHFEEEGLEPAEVKLENVRILFDLPEKE